MGRLRTAVHTLADLELPPDEIMSHLNDIVSGLGEESYTTCLYALYDSTTRTCSITRAGHPPPAVVHPDGTVHFPHPVPDPPLGVAEPPFETVELTMPPGSLLVLYTDGLIESSEREIDQGMTELAQLLRTREGEDLDRVCEDLIASTRSPPGSTPATTPPSWSPVCTRSARTGWPPGRSRRTPRRQAWPAGTSGSSCPRGGWTTW